MLILVGVTVTVALNGGLFNTAKKAVDETEILQEKEVIERAFILAQMGNGVQEARFRTCLEDEAGADNIELSAFGDEFEVYFKKSKRYYPVDKYGEIGDYEIVVEITNAGDITKGNTLDGSEEKPYEINCIEDLLALSYKTNGIKAEIDGALGTDSSTNYAGKQIILKRDLNFKSKYSYGNSERTDYGDVNGNGTVESLITELTTGKGWIPICSYTGKEFHGTFNGNGKTIKNLYFYNEEETTFTGLFGASRGATIENLGVEGNIHCNSEVVGGIIAGHGYTNATKRIENCYFKGEIENIRETSSYVGGIVGNAGDSGIISNCYTSGKIIGKDCAGGLTGRVGTASDSYNLSDVQGGKCVGGIVGRQAKVFNCYNTGSVSGTSEVGGIVGYRSTTIEKCYNTGDITGTSNVIGGIVGQMDGLNVKILKSYNAGKVKGTNYVGGILGWNHVNGGITIEQCYNLQEVQGQTNVGGIAGQIHGDACKVINCFNMAKVSGNQIAGIAIGGTANIKFISCYNKGEIDSATTNKFAVSGKGIITNCYYLQGCGATDALAIAKTEAELKAMHGTLDKKYTIDDTANTVTISETENQNVWVQDTNNINGGYPILKWQTEQ